MQTGGTDQEENMQAARVVESHIAALMFFRVLVAQSMAAMRGESKNWEIEGESFR